MEKIGIVGVGKMGSALLERLKLAGVEATAFDIAPSAAEAARSLGARMAASAKAVAQASTLIDVVVHNDQEVLDCTMGKDGILEGAQAGALVLLHSTIHPETTKKVAEAAGRRNVYVIDACMTAVPRIVRQGGLTFLVGGPAELVERARPHLLQMAKEAIHMGPLGTGNVAKLIKNLVTASETLIVHEAIRIGQAGGIPCREGSGGNSGWTFRSPSSSRPQAAAWSRQRDNRRDRDSCSWLGKKEAIRERAGDGDRGELLLHRSLSRMKPRFYKAGPPEVTTKRSRRLFCQHASL
ncbi:MAG: NAD(P)-dependent oxidoreductase [Deltaproteobacteria bacterium]|nr:NAD(P)-dependent oxidoreductase [Deltaproteobacteria bacterium]